VSGAGCHNAANRQNPGRQNASQKGSGQAANCRRDRQTVANGQDSFCNIPHSTKACGAAVTSCRAFGEMRAGSAVPPRRQYVWFVFGSWYRQAAGSISQSGRPAGLQIAIHRKGRLLARAPGNADAVVLQARRFPVAGNIARLGTHQRSPPSRMGPRYSPRSFVVIPLAAL
jgi:hypothetical protein